MRTNVIPIGGATAATEVKFDGDVIRFKFGPINKEYKYLIFSDDYSETPGAFIAFTSKDGKEWVVAYGAVTEKDAPIDLVATQNELRKALTGAYAGLASMT